MLESREMTGTILLYGATGFTGKLIAREARAKGASVLLAGRNPNRLKAVARPLDLPGGPSISPTGPGSPPR